MDLTAQPISPENLQELLGVDAPDYALGGYVREALMDLKHTRNFYALPAWAEPGLEGFEYHLREALKALHQTQELALGMAGK